MTHDPSSGRQRVFIARALPGDAAERIAEAGFSVKVHPGESGPTRDELMAESASCAGLLTLLGDRVDEELLDNAPGLKVVSNYAVGYDNIDVDAATRRGVAVCNTPGVLTDATAELALALLFSAARRTCEGDRFVRSGAFEGWSPMLLLGVEIRGKTLGIVGAGRIGQAVGQRAACLGCTVLYADGAAREAFETETGARRVPLDALLRASDFVSLHVPLTAETRRMIGAPELASMKPGAVLINTSRGPVVDEEALARALAEGPLRAAGLDVYEEEPAVHPALLERDNVVLLPHLGSAAEETREAMARLATDNLLAALSGKRPAHLVNPEAFRA